MSTKEKIIFSTPEAGEFLTACGLEDLESVFRLGRAVQPDRHSHKEVASATLETKRTRERIFIKRQWRRKRQVPRWGDLIRGQARQSDPVREWWGLTWLRAAGLDAAEPLGLYYRTRSMRSAVVTRAVPAATSFHDMLRAGSQERAAVESLEPLAEAVALTVRRMHAAGYAWRGVVARHFYPEIRPDSSWRVWLIDLEGVHRRLSPLSIRRDHRRLLESLKGFDIDPEMSRLLATKLGKR